MDLSLTPSLAVLALFANLFLTFLPTVSFPDSYQAPYVLTSQQASTMVGPRKRGADAEKEEELVALPSDEEDDEEEEEYEHPSLPA